MALILLGSTTCSICDRILNEGEDIVATSHFIADDKDPLWRYSDSGMHRACFVKWPEREIFISKFNEFAGKLIFGKTIYHEMKPDGTIVAIEHGV